MGIRDSLMTLGVPVGIPLLLDLEVLALAYKLVPHLQGMLEPIPKNIDRPVVGPPLIPVDHMHGDLQLGLVHAILASLYNLSIADKPILNGKTSFHFLVHFLGDEVELFNDGD